MKPDTNTSPRDSTFDTVASPGKRRPSRWTNSPSKRSVATGESRSTSARRRSSWRSRYSGGRISSRMLLPSASRSLQPNSCSAAAFHLVMYPSRSSVMNASGAVSSTSRVRSSDCSSSCECSCTRLSSCRIRTPATSGVPTASSQRTTTLSVS
jgi:hypothetical protein